jgi:rod shape-determining protein MreC
MNLFSRHKNAVVLATVLLAQLLALAVQVKRQTAEGPVRLIRFVAINGLAPFERVLIYVGEGVRGTWGNYIDLRNVRRENQQLRAEADQMRLDRAREQEDSRQARRIQALLQFKEQWIDTTVAAQVIGTSGTENSRLLYLDKGSSDGIKVDQPVITPDGVAGKILGVFGPHISQVLLINDSTSGVGATLVKSRLQGIVKGTAMGEVTLNYIMGDESVQPGEQLVTSGGDKVFPRGLVLGTVSKVSMGRDLFLNVKVKPAADLNRLEEVLVITSQKQREPDVAGLGPIRASDILSQHLPGVPQAQPPAPAQNGAQAPAASTPGAPQAAQVQSAPQSSTPKSAASMQQTQPAQHTAQSSSSPVKSPSQSTPHGASASTPHQNTNAGQSASPKTPAKPAATTTPAASEGTNPR